MDERFHLQCDTPCKASDGELPTAEEDRHPAKKGAGFYLLLIRLSESNTLVNCTPMFASENNRVASEHSNSLLGSEFSKEYQTTIRAPGWATLGRLI